MLRMIAMAEDPRALEIIKNMTGEQKLEASMRLYWSARELKAAAFRVRHPEWSEEKVQQEVRYAFLTMRD
jgi:hypothetical protein